MLSYIGIPPVNRGKFFPEKALKLGWVPHKHFRLLWEGKEVTLENGNIVK